MKILKYDSKYGRYYTTPVNDTWFIDPVFWSSYDKPLESLVKMRRDADIKNVNDIYDAILEDIKEIGQYHEFTK